MFDFPSYDMGRVAGHEEGVKEGIKKGETRIVLSGDEYIFTDPNDDGNIVVVKNEGEEEG